VDELFGQHTTPVTRGAEAYITPGVPIACPVTVVVAAVQPGIVQWLARRLIGK
jgi:hypothetical protein